MTKVYGMNVLEYIEYLMEEGMSEDNASEVASIEFSNAKRIEAMEK